MIHQDSATIQYVLSSRAPRVFSLPKMKLSVRRDAAAFQFRFYRVEEDLGWHHCKIGPEDDRNARGD
jgi:hypothetical protein